MGNIALVIIGQYQSAPPHVLNTSHQKDYDGLHGMAVARWPVKPPDSTWVSEYKGETDRMPSGSLYYDDCVQAAYVGAAALMTHGRVKASPTNRELLQHHEVSMGLLKLIPGTKVPQGSTLAAALEAGADLWDITAVRKVWAQGIANIDDGTGHCWCHDSLNANGGWIQVSVANIVKFAATNPTHYEFIRIPEEVPDVPAPVAGGGTPTPPAPSPTAADLEQAKKDGADTQRAADQLILQRAKSIANDLANQIGALKLE